MIKAIVFDLGGVYFSAGTQLSYNKLVKQFPDIDPDKIFKIIRKGKISRDYRRGKYTKKEFWVKARKLAGVRFDVKKFSHTWNSSYVLNSEVRGIVRKLRKRYKVAALSNNIKERVDFLDKRYKFRKDFDALFLSYIIGSNKPSSRIYNMMLKKLMLRPDECVFIDNGKRKVEAAKRLKIKSILFKNPAQLSRELKSFGVMI